VNYEINLIENRRDVTALSLKLPPINLASVFNYLIRRVIRNILELSLSLREFLLVLREMREQISKLVFKPVKLPLFPEFLYIMQNSQKLSCFPLAFVLN